MSDIEDGLFNNSDDDNDSDAGSVAESEVDFTNDKQPAVKTASKLNIGKVIVDGVLDDDAEEDDEIYGDGDVDAGSDGEGVIGDVEDDDDDDAVAGDDSDDENVRTAPVPKSAQILGADNMSDDDGDAGDEEDDDEDEDYLQKFDRDIKKNYIVDYHPECMIHNYEEISALTKVIRDKDNIIVDPLHRTIPYLTKYERARVLGQRAKQINLGARPFVKVPENIIDGNLVAEMELAQKRIPFIIRRPLPGNSGSEYWNLKDLEIITF
jgi:DNA-directed RNA polymerase I, II, and III subunit RPABC2